MTPGIPHPTNIELVQTAQNYLFFQLKSPTQTVPVTTKGWIAIKYNNTYNTTPEKNSTSEFATPDSTQNYYNSMAAGDFTFIPLEDVVQVDTEMYILKDYPTRQFEWYTMAYITIETADLDTTIVSTCTFKVYQTPQ
jgi:hypothetical protein